MAKRKSRRSYGKSKRRKRFSKKLKRYRHLKSPLPTKLLVKLKYYDFISINPGAGVFGNYVFSANGMYDPNITGSGHQPRGFDQLMAMYDHYVVIKSAISVVTHQLSTTPGGSRTVLTLQDNASLYGSDNDIMEWKNRKFVTMATGSKPGVLRHKFNNKFLGRSKPLSDSQLKGSNAANPVEQAYYHVYWYNPKATVNPGDTNFSINISFTAVLIEPKQPAQS